MEGYTALKDNENSVELGNLAEFRLGEKTKYHIELNEKDMSRLEKSIYEANAHEITQ